MRLRGAYPVAASVPATLGDLVRMTVQKNYAALADQVACARKQEIWNLLGNLIVEQLGVSRCHSSRRSAGRGSGNA